ncbi:UbiA family prenyltransferase [Marivita sp. GX14005]|uniref:UbiA family prenyltransferase n=1 Tax=Marivita sp. GX14005 TaxID=2942276 RepID=UPI0020194EB3|nr:UbiA family prenyltransferase [Marivita sp. GX14005]MCL3881725.1 UbiA family prenyltransferase [Marivita sp. GX14005]
MDDARYFESVSKQTTLVVDLDGSLIRTDLLYETFWAAISKRWLNVFPALGAVFRGRAVLKRRLSELGEIDVSALPYNSGVLKYVAEWHAQGGRTALVSASDQRLVSRVADHLGIFDDAIGSDGRSNLKGATKAARLNAVYGDAGYAYIGDSRADLAVWKDASEALTVGIAPSLEKRVRQVSQEATTLSPHEARLPHVIRAMRPHQWLKNVLVFLPLLAAHQFDFVTLSLALATFIAFSLIASSVYLLNDLLDLAADRAHPRKRMRPFASGDLPLSWGSVLAPGLLLAGFAIAVAISPMLAAVLAFYYLATTVYSFLLKRKLIVDICALAGLYTLRIIAGAVATGIPLSVWLLAFSTFFFFSLAAMKRQAELAASSHSKSTIIAGRDYKTTDLPIVANMSVASGYVSVLVMALYLNTPDVERLYSYPASLWGICLVLLYWLSRMVMITHRGWMHDDPVVFAARDYISIICAGLILVFALGGVLL